MKNSSHTQERSPKLTGPIRSKSPLLATYPWLLLVVIGFVSVAIAVMAMLSLTNIGQIEKDPAKQTTIVPQKSITPNKNKISSSPNWWLIVLLGAGVASGVAIYKWRSPLTALGQGRLTRRQQRKLLLQQGGGAAILPNIALEHHPASINLEPVAETSLESQFVETVPLDTAPNVAVLPPEAEVQPSDLSKQSLAEMMDIRKHLSLSAILQDFKRPD